MYKMSLAAILAGIELGVTEFCRNVCSKDKILDIERDGESSLEHKGITYDYSQV